MERSPHDSSSLPWLAKRGNWMKNSAIKLSITKNPKTPLPIVEKTIQTLSTDALMRIAKGSDVREKVARMAKRILGQRGVIIGAG